MMQVTFDKVSIWFVVATFGALFLWGVPTLAADKKAEAPGEGDWIVSAERAAGLVSDDQVTVLDARGRDAWKSGHVPGSMVVDWTSFTPEETFERGTLLEDNEALQTKLRRLGVSNDTPVLVVGHADGGWGEAGRIVWMLRTLGHAHAAMVDGGQSALVTAGVEPSTRSSTTEVGDFEISRRNQWTVGRSDLREIFDDKDVVMLDTREAREFSGETPYGESRGGHIPGAKHLYFKSLLGDDGRLKPKETIRHILEARGVRRGSRVITYCTGGVRSAWVAGVLIDMGYEDVRNFAGSTWKWSAGPKSAYPLETD
jgi:thiosulfate/3-mercaptopyruvate sulfurtransferase